MIGELPSCILVAVHWFKPTSRDCPNPVKSKFKVMMIVTRVFLQKNLGMRVVWKECEFCGQWCFSMRGTGAMVVVVAVVRSV